MRAHIQAQNPPKKSGLQACGYNSREDDMGGEDRQILELVGQTA